MTKNQKDYIVSQLDKMAEELESVEDVAKRAELRGKYIEIFIDMCTVSNMSAGVVHEEELVEEEVEESIVEDVEEPKSVTAETEAIVEEESANVKDADEIFEDAEVVRTVLDDNDEEVDITDAYNELINERLDENTADSIGLFLTENECLEAYKEKFNYMNPGLPRAYAACMATVLTEQQLIAYIVDFSNLEINAVEHSTDFIDDANAEALFDFIFPNDDEE